MPLRLISTCNWQATNANARVVQNNNTAAEQSVLDIPQVPQQQRELPLRPAINRASKQNHGRSASHFQREQSAKVRVCRNENSILLLGSRKDRVVFR